MIQSILCSSFVMSEYYHRRCLTIGILMQPENLVKSLVRDSVTSASKRVIDRAEEDRQLRLALVGEIVGEALGPNRKTNHLLYQRLEAMKRHKDSWICSPLHAAS